MKKTNENKGITLIALIITIILMLILASITINMTINGGLFGYAGKAKYETEVASEKETVQKARIIAEGLSKTGRVSVQDIQKAINNVTNEGIATVFNNGETIIVRFTESNRYYKIEKDGSVELLPTGVHLNTEEILLAWKKGEQVKKEITAKLIQVEGEINWTNTNDSVATISNTTGDKITVTAVSNGTTEIKATCGEYSTICELNVITTGNFIEYNVEYKDAYYNDYNYSATNGWRLQDFTANEDGTYSNVKIMSTGIPAKLYYNGWVSTYPSWWETDEEKLIQFKEILGGSEYIFTSSGVNWKGLQVSAGLYYNFNDIKFSYSEEKRGDNLAHFTSIKSNGITYNKDNTEEKTGGELFNLYGNKATVRIITLPEINKALGRTDIDSGAKAYDEEGLYRITAIKNINGMEEFIYSGENFWMASPPPNTTISNFLLLCMETWSGRLDIASADATNGVRPLICINSDVEFTDKNSDGVIEINLK